MRHVVTLRYDNCNRRSMFRPIYSSLDEEYARMIDVIHL